MTRPVNENILQSLLGQGEKPEAGIICSAWKMAWTKGGYRKQKKKKKPAQLDHTICRRVANVQLEVEQWKNEKEK